jgi:NitT/TauT family transport system permease protein
MRVGHIKPRRGARILIGAGPIMALVIIQTIFLADRAEANPNDKVLPTFAAMARTVVQLTSQSDPRTGQITAWSDTIGSLWRPGARRGAIAARRRADAIGRNDLH